MRAGAIAVLTLLGASTVHAGDDGVFTLGVDGDLVAGADALSRGRFEEGIELTASGLGSAISRDQRASALNNLCAGHAALRRYAIAVVYCSESLDLEPGWQAYNNRAIAYLGQGLVRLARRDVELGLALNPGDERLLQVRAMVEERAGEGPRDPIT